MQQRHCNTTLQHGTTATALQQTTRCNTEWGALQIWPPSHATTTLQQRHCNTTLQHDTATRHCNTATTTTRCNTEWETLYIWPPSNNDTATRHCNTALQHGTATDNTLQHRVRSPTDLTSMAGEGRLNRSYVSVSYVGLYTLFLLHMEDEMKQKQRNIQ